jgi:hypothetical protein
VVVLHLHGRAQMLGGKLEGEKPSAVQEHRVQGHCVQEKIRRQHVPSVARPVVFMFTVSWGA